MGTIKNIIFDFGDVLIDLDKVKFERRVKEFIGQHTVTQREKVEAIFVELEVGAISILEFTDKISDVMERKINADKMIAVYNTILLTIPEHRFDFLKEVKGKYNTYLLSNTNIIHLSWIYDYLERTYEMLDFDERFFRKTYYSHQIKMRKPNRDIYEYVLKDAGLKAEETMFIDDNADNIKMANEVGIIGILHNPKNDITTSFDKYISATV